MTQLGRTKSWRLTAAVSLVLAVGVVTWQHVIHATTTLRSDAAVASHLPHLMRDIAAAMPLAVLAVVLGQRLARLIGGRAAPLWLSAAVTTEIFMVTMLAGVPIHSKIDAALGAGHASEGAWLFHAVRDAIVGQFVAFPLMVLAFWAASNPSVAFRRANVARAAAVTVVAGVLAAMGASGALVVVLAALVAVLVSVGHVNAIRHGVVLTLIGATLAIPGPLSLIDSSPAGAIPDANGCDSGANVRSYDVAAIDITMTLNRFGDNDPGAMMYVLENRIADVRAQEATGEVTPGLRTDAIQPLVIRANVGECLEINFRNDLAGQDASFHAYGLPFTAANAGGEVGNNPNSNVAPGGSVTYRFPIPDDPNAEGAYNFHSQADPRQTMAHGLFGTLVVEPEGSVYLDPEDATQPLESGWEAIIVDPRGIDFREFVIMMHEVGDEEFDVTGGDGDPMPQLDDVSGSYRPGSRALNYRSEPFRNRLLLDNDKSLAYSSYTFGDPATPIPRSYLGEPTKTRLTHPGSEMFHVYHLHGGGDRWPRNPDASSSDFASGLNKAPALDIQSTRLDSQAVGPGESFDLEHECGAGGCQQAAGDFLFHCHIGSHYVSGMWSFWRVFDTVQGDLALMPDDPGYMPPPVATAGNSLDLIGTVVDGKTIVADDDLVDPINQIALEDYVASLLPPQGVPIDDEDATVWDWQILYPGGDLSQPLVVGEPDDDTVWPNYESPTPGVRPELQFNLSNGRLTWPQFSPHLGQRPPFAPNGHGGAPWLGEDVTGTRPDGLCPTTGQVPGRRILDYPITAIDLTIPISDTLFNPNGMIYALSEDVADIRNGLQKAEPLVLRSNVGDCLDVLLTSEQDDANHGGFAKVNMHTHFVQFDPQASDGVITGFSYEQSVRPYESENRELDVAATPGQTVIETTGTTRLRVGISIGVGLGEGMCDSVTGLPVADPDFDDRRCTEIRTITALGPSNTITLDAPLVNHHAIGEAVGVEFVQYRWYSDTDEGTVFFHDHVDFNRWNNGLFAAHIVEPAGASYHDPTTGAEIRTGTIADIRVPAATDIGGGRTGSFREAMIFLTNGNPATDGINDATLASLSLRSAPTAERDGEFPFSSVVNGDPLTPQLRAYVGDNVIFRNLGVVERVGALRVAGHRYQEDAHDPNSPVYDTASVGISAREDLVLLDGAGGPQGLPGDYMIHSTKSQDLENGAWGVFRVHDTDQGDLLTLPDGPAPPAGAGFPQLTETGLPPALAADPGNPCPPFAPVRPYSVSVFDAPLGATFGQTMFALAVDEPDIIAGLKEPVPLVLRVNDGECLEINVFNNSGRRAGFSLAKLAADPQGSAGTAVGFNPDSTIDKGAGRNFRYYADQELGTALFTNLAETRILTEGGWGAVIVEPAGSAWLDPETGLQIDSGVEAIVWTPGGETFREFVALLQDDDGDIGQNVMPYPVFTEGPTGINYRTDLLNDGLGGRMNAAPVGKAFDSGTFNDPKNLFEAYAGDPVVFRVGLAAGKQAHVFGIDGHRFPWANNIAGSEMLSTKGLLPMESFDLKLDGGAGAGLGGGTDYLFGDRRMPFMEGGAWGILRVHDDPQPNVQPLPLGGDGLLRVTTNPPLPSSVIVDGHERARWGLSWMKIGPGEHEVCFSDVEGFITPACQTVTVNPGATTTVEGLFVQNGFLRIITDPPVPATLYVDGAPVNDWGFWTDLPVGNYTVCFGDVQDFITPACQPANVTAGALTTITGNFVADAGQPGPGVHGLLRVETVPAVPSQLYVDGAPANRWGLSWMKIDPGWHEVCFGDVIGYTTPSCQTVHVDPFMTTTVQGMFDRRGWLEGLTSPAMPSTISLDGVPMNDWGVWADLPPGPYEVCFGEAGGFTPACEPIVIAPAAVTTVTGIWPP